MRMILFFVLSVPFILSLATILQYYHYEKLFRSKLSTTLNRHHWVDPINPYWIKKNLKYFTWPTTPLIEIFGWDNVSALRCLSNLISPNCCPSWYIYHPASIFVNHVLLYVTQNVIPCIVHLFLSPVIFYYRVY